MDSNEKRKCRSTIGCCETCKIPIKVKCYVDDGSRAPHSKRFCSRTCASRGGVSPYTLLHWINKGFSEEEAYIKVKECRPFNIEYWLAKGFSEEDAKIKLSELQSDNVNKFMEKRKNDPEKYKDIWNTSIGYWLNKTDGDEEAAELLLYERQAVGRLSKFQERYGKKDGKRKWKERQIKWQDTMKAKPIEEIERINRAKQFKNSYSKSSQHLFWLIYEEINMYIKDVRFATICNGEQTNSNSEYIHVFPDGSAAFLDFLIEHEKINIEFDGEYWHKLDDRQISDKIRDEKLKRDGFKILRIPELDWLADKNKVLLKCLEFINENTNQRISRVLREISPT